MRYSDCSSDNRVKRLRLSTPQPLPRSFTIPGALRTEVEDHHATVTVTNFNDKLVGELKQTWNAEVDVSDLNLEEIFVELHEVGV